MYDQRPLRRRAGARMAAIALALGMALLLAACGDNGDNGETPEPQPGTPTPTPTAEATPDPADDGTPEPTPTPEPEDEATPEPQPEVRNSSIVDFQLESMTISAGTSVRWMNDDSFPHTATHVDGEWDSGNLNQGEAFTYEFSEPGTFEYYCVVHPQMTGTITVE